MLLTYKNLTTFQYSKQISGSRFCWAKHMVLIQQEMPRGKILHKMVTQLIQATHFSMKKPGSHGWSGASVAGRNMRWPSFVGPNGVEGGLTWWSWRCTRL